MQRKLSGLCGKRYAMHVFRGSCIRLRINGSSEKTVSIEYIFVFGGIHFDNVGLGERFVLQNWKIILSEDLFSRIETSFLYMVGYLFFKIETSFSYWQT